MAKGIWLKSGGGVTSEDVSIRRHQALRGTRLLTSDSNDGVVGGMMPDNSTRTSNGTVPGVSSDRAELPTRYTESMFISTDTAGNRRLNMSPPQGYYPGGRKSFVSHRAIELGNAVAGQVLSGATFSSEQGLKLWGEVPGWLPRVSGWSDVVYAWNDEVKVGDDAQGNRGIYTKIPNGHYINGANWVFSKEANLRPENIRAGVSIAGMVGTMPDYSTGRVVFNGATFDGLLVSGVADKTVHTTTGERTTFDSQTSSNLRRCSFGDGDGIYFYVGVNNRGSRTAPYAGAFLGNSVDMTPFRKVKIGYRLEANGWSDSEAFTCGVGLDLFLLDKNKTTISTARNGYEGNLPSMNIFAESFMVGGRELEFSKNGVQYFVELDISGYNGQHFIGFGADGSTDINASRGYANIWLNYIELIN